MLNFFQDILTIIGDFFTWIADFFVDLFANFFNFLWLIIVDLFTSFLDFVFGFFDSILAELPSLWGWVSGDGYIGKVLFFYDYFFDLSYTTFCLSTILTIYFSYAIYKLVKSWVPMLSGT